MSEFSSNEVKLVIGCTTGYEIQANEVREAILVDNKRKKLEEQGYRTKVILFNDDIDIFTSRHLKISSKTLSTDLSEEVGKAIYKINLTDTDTVASYFLDKFIKKLEELEIRIDFVINSSEVRKSQDFLEIKRRLLENKDIIVDDIMDNFGLEYQHKYFKVMDEEGFYHRIYNFDTQSLLNSPGKFPWAIECMIRWLLLDVDYEFFTKNYLTYPKGSYYISRFIMEKYFKDYKEKAPKPKQYEYINFSKNLLYFYQLLSSSQYKELILSNPNKVNYLNEESVLQILKNNYYKNSSKTYYEIFNFLSHFNESHIIDSRFRYKFKETFVGDDFNMYDLYYFYNKLDIFKQFYFERKRDIKNTDISHIFYSYLNDIYNLKISSMDFNAFKAEIRSLFKDLQKMHFIEMNKSLFGKEKGIPIPLFLYLIPTEEFYSLTTRESSNSKVGDITM